MKRYKVICPLINFQIPWGMLMCPPERTAEETKMLFKERRERVVKGIQLVDGVKIRYISNEDLEDLKTWPFSLPHGVLELISPRMFVLEKHVKVENGNVIDYHKVMKDVVLSLRLLKSGMVFGSYVFSILLSKKRRLASMSFGEDRPRSAPGTYTLEFEEVPKLRTLIKRVQNIDFPKRKSLDLACKRFQRAYEERYAEDRLIDLMIAHEALFLKGEKGGPSPGKIVAVACSTLLGKNEDEREEIRRTLVEAYLARNHIVHGSENPRMKPYDQDGLFVDPLSDLVLKAEDYLRESIKKRLD